MPLKAVRLNLSLVLPVSSPARAGGFFPYTRRPPLNQHTLVSGEGYHPHSEILLLCVRSIPRWSPSRLLILVSHAMLLWIGS